MSSHIIPSPVNSPGLLGQAKTSFLDLGSNPGPGRLPLESGRGNVEVLQYVFASVASLAVSFVPEFVFQNPNEKK